MTAGRGATRRRVTRAYGGHSATGPDRFCRDGLRVLAVFRAVPGRRAVRARRRRRAAERGLKTLVFRVRPGEVADAVASRFRLRIGATATVAAAALIVALPNPAVPVLAVGLAATALHRVRPQLDARALSLLFVFAVALGVGGRLWRAPAGLLDGCGAWSTAALGAAASVVINNLPAAALLSSQPVGHPDALLLGLDLGPNLAVTGSLSALLWLQAARAVRARPSIATYSRLGLLLVPLTLAAALLVNG
jgi:arsenical pump membrane protein